MQSAPGGRDSTFASMSRNPPVETWNEPLTFVPLSMSSNKHSSCPARATRAHPRSRQDARAATDSHGAIHTNTHTRFCLGRLHATRSARGRPAGHPRRRGAARGRAHGCKQVSLRAASAQLLPPVRQGTHLGGVDVECEGPCPRPAQHQQQRAREQC